MNAGLQELDPVLHHVRFYSDKALTETGFPPSTSDVPWLCCPTNGLYKVKGKVHTRTGYEIPE